MNHNFANPANWNTLAKIKLAFLFCIFIFSRVVYVLLRNMCQYLFSCILSQYDGSIKGRNRESLCTYIIVVSYLIEYIYITSYLAVLPDCIQPLV